MEVRNPAEKLGIPGYSSSLGRLLDEQPEPFQRLLKRLIEGHGLSSRSKEFADFVFHRVMFPGMRIREEFGLAGQAEKIIIHRGDELYYLQFERHSFSTGLVNEIKI